MRQAFIVTIVFLVLDAMWLGWLANAMYVNALHPLLRYTPGVGIQPIWSAAVVVYIALIAGLLVFVIPKAAGDPIHALCYGALFGAITYATYDFTNYALLSGWSLKVAIIDTVWGMIICSATSVIAVLMSTRHA